MTRWKAIWEHLSHRWTHYVLGALCFCGVYQALCHTEAFVDDAAITFSYARQLVDTGELIHTAGAERVEGFSNPTWLALSCIPFLLGMDPYAFARAVGVLCMIATILLVYRTATLLCPQPGPSPTGGALVQALAPFSGFWVVAGLETPFVAFLLAAALYQTLREELDDSRHWSGAILAVLALSRPEGIMFAGPIGLYKLCKGWPTIKKRGFGCFLRRHVGNLAALVVPVGAFLLWRCLYFGAWLPNTYFAKVHEEPVADNRYGGLSRGRFYVLRYLEENRLWPLVYASPLAFFVPKRIPEAALILTTVGLHVVFVLQVNGDWMGDFRFFAMTLPAWALLIVAVMRGGATVFGAAVSAMGKRWKRLHAPKARARALFAAEAVLLVALLFAVLLPALENYERKPWIPMEAVRAQASNLELFARAAGLQTFSMAVPDVGGSGMTVNARIIDTAGLTDRVFARNKLQPGRLRQYVFEEMRPDLYQEHTFWRHLYNFPLHHEFQRDYVRIQDVPGTFLKIRPNNFFRREHFVGTPAEMDSTVSAEMGHGYHLVGFDTPTAFRKSVVARFLVVVPGPPPPGQGFVVDFRAPNGQQRSASVDPATLPDGIFVPGAKIRLRAFTTTEPFVAMRVRGPEQTQSPWLDVSAEKAGKAAGADLARYLLHPRSHFACASPPTRWRPELRGSGRIQRFNGCRLRFDRAEMSNMARELRLRAQRAMDSEQHRAALTLLGRLELLRPKASVVRSLSRRAAKIAYQQGRQKASEGQLEQARQLFVAALKADPLLVDARNAYLSLADKGLTYLPDRRARLETAKARLQQNTNVVALKELLRACLAADRAEVGARFLYESMPHPANAMDGSARLLAAQVYLSQGLCEESLNLLEGDNGCAAQWARYDGQTICGLSAQVPQCVRSASLGHLERYELLMDFEGDNHLDGWETSGPLVQRSTPSHYASGGTGTGMLRTDWSAQAHWTGTSPELPLAFDALSLQVGGGTEEEDGVSVSLIVDGQQVARASGRGDSHMRTVTWNVAPWVGRRALLRVEDRGDGRWGYLLLDHVRSHPAHYLVPAADPN